MANYVSVDLLKPHPKNAEYFSEPDPEEYEKIKRSVAAHGIRDPLKVLPDYTVVAGNLRLRIARDLGLEKVPVEVWDVPPEEAEYLLVADNEERRVCKDPIKKARRAKFLEDYWGVRRGGDRRSKPQNAVLKTLKDVAEAVGESSEDAIQRLLKLNGLIPSLQELVSAGKLRQTAAYSLAFLPPEEQEELLQVLGESGVCGLSVKEAQELRRALEAERRAVEEARVRLAEAEKRLAEARKDSEEAAELRSQVEALRRENEELRARGSVERVVEKVVYRPDPAAEAELEALRKQAANLLREKEWAERRLREAAEEKVRSEAKMRALEDEANRLRQMLDHAHRELEKEKSRPKPPQWSKEHLEFQGLLQEASRNAASLASSLARILEKHRDRLVAAARVRGAPGDDVRELAEAVGDALLFKAFDAALKAAVSRAVDVWDVLEPGKPRLQVLRGKGRE